MVTLRDDDAQGDGHDYRFPGKDSIRGRRPILRSFQRLMPSTAGFSRCSSLS